MTENNRFVDDLSLEYFLNKETYGKHLEKRTSESKREYRKDKRFYRKRIYDLTKQLINSEETTIQNYSKDIQMAFEFYTRVCIDYFKVLDKNDVIQEDYVHLLESNSQINLDPQLNVEHINSIEEADHLLMRSIKIVEPNSLEKLVKRKTTKNVKKEMPLPLQKNIDLKDPSLKKKGIKEKKKNMSNIYDKEVSENKKI